MQPEYTAPSFGRICQSYITGGIFRQFVYTIFAYSEQLIHHAISSQSSYNHQSSILQSNRHQLSPVILSPVITQSHHISTSSIQHHIILTLYHIILISHYSLRYFTIPLFTICFLPYILFPLHIISPLMSYHSVIIHLTIRFIYFSLTFLYLILI